MIDSLSNATVKVLRSLDQPKQVRARRQFLAEGVRAVEDGLRAGFVPDVCLYNGELLRRTERGARLLGKLLELMKSRPRPAILEATPRALEAASATLHPQGVVAAFPLIEWARQGVPEGSTPLALVCDNIQDPGNLGTILRTAEAAGVQAVYLSPSCVDPYNPKVVRAAMGAHFRLPVYSLPWMGIAEALVAQGVPRARIFATEAEAETPYDAVDWTLPAALIVSNEAHGLSREAVALAGDGKQVVAIPMDGGTESLNAATAAAVILFEAARQRRARVGAEGERRGSHV